MGFGPKFIRMWQYYFVYCAVGFKTRTLGDLQVGITSLPMLLFFGTVH